MTHLHYDMRNATLPEFEAFIFDHKPENIGSSSVWYFQDELRVEFDLGHNAALFVKLFENSTGLADRFSVRQLEQGCWAMLSGFDGNLEDLIWRSQLSIDIKARLIFAMFHMYQGLFSVILLESSCSMWWDSLAYGFHPMHTADPDNNPEHFQIRETMYATLSKILDLSSKDCQEAALHGLNHVQHPETVALVDRYIASHPELSPEAVVRAKLFGRGK